GHRLRPPRRFRASFSAGGLRPADLLPPRARHSRLRRRRGRPPPLGRRDRARGADDRGNELAPGAARLLGRRRRRRPLGACRGLTRPPVPRPRPCRRRPGGHLPAADALGHPGRGRGGCPGRHPDRRPGPRPVGGTVRHRRRLHPPPRRRHRRGGRLARPDRRQHPLRVRPRPLVLGCHGRRRRRRDPLPHLGDPPDLPDGPARGRRPGPLRRRRPPLLLRAADRRRAAV
ncbi:MAG: hypothetical protein AVDCRST_MAG59-3804, partial [uncultured Thermomicrobiales bacterium]